MISACSEGLSAVLCFVCPGARFDDGAGGDNEVQRTMLELINQLDGFDPRGNIKVLMATNRPDTLDPALMRPGRLDRKIEFSLPDLEVRMLFFRCRVFSGISVSSVCFITVWMQFTRVTESSTPNLGETPWKVGGLSMCQGKFSHAAQISSLAKNLYLCLLYISILIDNPLTGSII